MNISANLLLSRKADATNRKGAHTLPLERNMDYMKKILVLEDEPSIRSFVVINLRRSGYEPIEAATGEEALEKLKQNPDTLVALLDVMLPDIDGFEVCRRIRATGSKMGILMLSAKSQEMDKITGLMTGADDYVTKPFSPAELLARVDALYRRIGGSENTEDVLSSGPFVLHLRSRTLDKNSEHIRLTQTEFAIMKLFMENPGRALSREDILHAVWGADYNGEVKIVDVTSAACASRSRTTRPNRNTSPPSGATAISGATEAMQDVTPTPAGEPKQENTFRGLFSRMAMGQCVHAALCVAIGAAIGLSAGRVSTALGIILGILAAAAGAVICALWFRRHVSRPVEQITEVTRTIAGGRYGTELPVQRDDELGRLATAINELSQEISRSEKMQSEFISSISHELRTPLTAITGWSETLMFDTAIQGDSRRGIAIISKEAARLTSLVEELLEFTRIQDGRFNLSMELLDIESELEDTIFTYQELLRQDGMQLIYNPPEEEIPLVPGDPERLKQVFLNILDNAAKYARDGKTIEVSVFSDSEAATIQFRDHGPGIPENELPHVKEKFFKGEKHKARGSGIGLAVCDEIITRSGGTLTIANAPGGGTLVSVRLPFAPESGN